MGKNPIAFVTVAVFIVEECLLFRFSAEYLTEKCSFSSGFSQFQGHCRENGV